jgi:hypothetical protein
MLGALSVQAKDLVGREFLFGRLHRRKNLNLQTAGKFLLLPNGRIGGSHHPNETFWELTGSVLSFSGPTRMVTTGFTGAQEMDYCAVLTGHCLVAPYMHFLYPYKALKDTGLKLLYVVASHARYSIPRDRLLSQMTLAGVPAERIWVTVAESPQNEVRQVRGMTYSFVKENAFEYIGLIDIVRREVPCDVVFLMHDTCHVGMRFRERVESQPWTFPIDYLSAQVEGLFNIGLYRKQWLVQIREFLLGLLGVSKERAIAIEKNIDGQGFKNLAPVTSNFIHGWGKETGIHYPYSKDVPRTGVYLRGTDMHKFFGPTSTNSVFKP